MFEQRQFCNSTKFIMGCLMDGSKAGKIRNQDGSGRPRHRKMEERQEKEQWHLSHLLLCTRLAESCAGSLLLILHSY